LQQLARPAQQEQDLAGEISFLKITSWSDGFRSWRQSNTPEARWQFIAFDSVRPAPLHAGAYPRTLRLDRIHSTDHHRNSRRDQTQWNPAQQNNPRDRQQPAQTKDGVWPKVSEGRNDVGMTIAQNTKIHFALCKHNPVGGAESPVWHYGDPASNRMLFGGTRYLRRF
jgi:hypothetical protein